MLFLVTLLAAGAVIKAQNITYNVIASPDRTQSVVVVVDNTTWPITASDGGILYRGEAPIAQTGYHYAMLESNKQINASEGFSRAPSHNDTVNEFFNRPQNTYQVATLPQLLPPLEEIHRINSDLHINGQIPTIHIWGNASAVTFLHQNQLEDVDVELNFTYYGLQDVQTFENVKVSLAGRSSRYISKLSYDIKMKKKNDDNLYGYKNLKLRALGMDSSYIREYICYHAIKSVGLATSEFSYVRLFINNQPVGFYGIIETFQDPWLASEFASGDSSYESGYLYQGEFISATENQTIYGVSDLGYYPNLTYYTGSGYKIKAGPSKKGGETDYVTLQTFTKFIQDASSNTTTDEWNSKLNVDGFIRAMVIENLLGLSDAYMTMANNYYLYSDPKSGRMTYMPADLDTTIGIALYDMDMMVSGNYTAHPGFTFRPLTRKLFSHDTFSNTYQQLLQNLTQNLVDSTIMGPYIDSIVNMIKPDVEWDDRLVKMGKVLKFPLDIPADALQAFFPPGFRTNWTDIPQTFDSSINGPTNSTTTESVKGFIQRKSDAIKAFYKLG